MFKIPSIDFLKDAALGAFKRFPGVLVSALVATAAGVYMVQIEAGSDSALMKLMLAALLGLPVFLSIKIFMESRWRTDLKSQLIGNGLGVAFLGGVFAWLMLDHTESMYLRYFQLSLAAHLTVAFAPFIGRNMENGFWQFNRYIFQRISLSFVYAAVLYIGIVIGFATITNLFKVELPKEWYVQIWIICAILFQTWHFVTGLPKDINGLQDDQTYPKPLKVFVQFLLIPLVSFYMLILYTYMVKVLITGVWPEGYIGWLVSSISILGIFNILLISPEKTQQGSTWIKKYSQAYYYLVMPLLGMLFVAIGKRINEYGITENRYFLLVLGLLLMALALYYIFSKSKKLIVIPASLFAISLITMVGPTSAYSVSFYSQKNRAEAILTQLGALKDGKVVKIPSYNSKDIETNLSSILRYLEEYHGDGLFKQWAPADLKYEHLTETQKKYRSRHEHAKTMIEYIGLEYRNQWGSPDRTYLNYYANGLTVRPFNVAGFRYATRVERYTSFVQTVEGTDLTISHRESTHEIVINDSKGNQLALDLDEVYKDLVEKTAKKDDHELPKGMETVEKTFGNLSLRFIIEEINGNIHGKEVSVTSYRGMLMIK